MSHLIYDFKQIAESKGLSVEQMEPQMLAMVFAMQSEGITKIYEVDENGDYQKDEKFWDDAPYLEGDRHNMVIKIRKLTHLPKEKSEKIWQKAELVANMVISVVEEPCNRCDKRPHNDYDGICQDCADELGVSEMFISDSKEKWEQNFKKAKVYFNSFRNNIGSASFKVKKDG